MSAAIETSAVLAHDEDIKSRAEDIIRHVLFEYNELKDTIDKEAQSVNLMCSVGGREFEVHRIGAGIRTDFLKVSGKGDDGVQFKVFAPVEQFSFTITLSNKASKTPPREIGFKADMV